MTVVKTRKVSQESNESIVKVVQRENKLYQNKKNWQTRVFSMGQEDQAIEGHMLKDVCAKIAAATEAINSKIRDQSNTESTSVEQGFKNSSYDNSKKMSDEKPKSINQRKYRCRFESNQIPALENIPRIDISKC